MSKTTGYTRRQFIVGGTALAACANPAISAATATRAPGRPQANLVAGAMAALERHRGSFAATDRIGIADFSAPSGLPRFHILDVASGESRALLVAHGRGSDPAHTGWLQRFSNEPGSNATSAGTYLTGAAYTGSHGPSRRLTGLDPANSNAEARAIVIHSAWYANPSVAREQGKLGRSEGCFAFPQADIDFVLDRLGEGRMIYAMRS